MSTESRWDQRLRRSLRPPGSDTLTKRVRWLFLVLLSLVVFTTVVGTILSPLPLPSRPGGVAAILVWWCWALYRYRRPRAPLATDTVPLLAMAMLGLSTGSTFLLFAPGFVSLYYRTMFGSRRQAYANGFGYFVVYQLVWAATTAASGPVNPLGTGIILVSFVGTAVVMQALGAAARNADQLMVRERVLTGLSSDFLQAASPEDVHRLAVEGALELTQHGSSVPSATLWLGGDELRLVATAGPDRADHQQVLLDSAPAHIIARFLEGAPFVLDRTAVEEVQHAFGQRDLFQEMLVVPMARQGSPAGLLAVVSPTALPRELVGLMGRFANEIILALDRTELLEDLRQANLHLREANAAKDEFVSTVSHELRTPLTSIRGFATTLRQRWPVLTDDERNQYLEIIERQSRTQQRLVEDLLTSSRAMADQLPVSPTEIPVKSMFQETLEVLPLDATQVTVSCLPGLHLVADPDHLRQVITNLLSNAQKYGAAPYQLHAERDGDEVVITVSDDGPGVPADFRDRLFEPFTQAETGDTRTSRGVGLGLSIVRRLVVANGGSIALREDRSASGACFEVRLPRAVGSVPDDDRGEVDEGLRVENPTLA